MQVRLLAKLNLLLSCALLATSIAGCTAMNGLTASANTAEAENKAAVLRSEAELWSKGNLAVADQVYSPNFVCIHHGARVEGTAGHSRRGQEPSHFVPPIGMSESTTSSRRVIG